MGISAATAPTTSVKNGSSVHLACGLIVKIKGVFPVLFCGRRLSNRPRPLLFGCAAASDEENLRLPALGAGTGEGAAESKPASGTKPESVQRTAEWAEQCASYTFLHFSFSRRR